MILIMKQLFVVFNFSVWLSEHLDQSLNIWLIVMHDVYFAKILMFSVSFIW